MKKEEVLEQLAKLREEAQNLLRRYPKVLHVKDESMLDVRFGTFLQEIDDTIQFYQELEL